MRRLFCALLALALLASTAASAEGGAANWYEVFVRSYQDSDGDGLGDLNGLMARLDYIRDMGWNGLWVMPVMPSPSYHKYDVTDYMAVDEAYGTLKDMRDLAAACRERGIALIVDMPVNHTSTRHPWFVKATEALAAGDADDPHVGYYNFAREAAIGYAPLGDTGWYYEERFAGGGMPDLNLDNPAVLEEIEAIFDFWLKDMGVDGFRLDAVTSYFTGDAAKNVALLSRFKAMAEALKPGSLLIGECWDNLNTIARYYDSGADGFFLFPAAQGEGFVAAALRPKAKNPGEKFATAYQKVLDAIPGASLAPFLCNHDTGRTVGVVQGRNNPAVCKFAEGVLGMLNGRVFTYYGEEIGMVGSGDDPNKRLAMYWSDTDMTDQPPGVTAVEYAYPSVEAQADNPDSLLNYVRAVNAARLRHPEIAWGENAFLLAEGSLCLMAREWNGARCLVAINFSASEAGEMDVGPCAIDCDLEAAGGAAALSEDGTRLVLPPYGIAILTEVQG